MGMSRKAGPTRREVTAGSAGVAGEAGPVCSPGCDESNASGWPSPPGRGGRSHEGHSSGDPTLNAGTLETLGGEGAWSGVPRRCEWEQGQTLLSPPGARNSPYGRPACLPGFYLLDLEMMLESAKIQQDTGQPNTTSWPKRCSVMPSEESRCAWSMLQQGARRFCNTDDDKSPPAGLVSERDVCVCVCVCDVCRIELGPLAPLFPNSISLFRDEHCPE